MKIRFNATVSKSYKKMKTFLNVEASVPTHYKMVALSIFSSICKKMYRHRPIFLNFTNNRYLFC